MGFFDRLREKLRGSTPSPEPDSVAVPAGHQVELYGPSPEPGLRQTPGGVLIADLGLGGDELPEDVDAVVDQLEHKVAQGARARLATIAGRLTDLFAPAEVEAVPALVVVWYIWPPSLTHSPVFLASRLRRILGEEAAGTAFRLDQELLGRKRQFLLLANPYTGQIAPQNFEGIEALAAFPDAQSVNWAAADMKIAEPKFIGVSPQDLVKIAAHNRVGLAFNIYANRQTPEYVLRRPDEVERLRRSFGGQI